MKYVNNWMCINIYIYVIHIYTYVHTRMFIYKIRSPKPEWLVTSIANYSCFYLFSGARCGNTLPLMQSFQKQVCRIREQIWFIEALPCESKPTSTPRRRYSQVLTRRHTNNIRRLQTENRGFLESSLGGARRGILINVAGPLLPANHHRHDRNGQFSNDPSREQWHWR